MDIFIIKIESVENIAESLLKNFQHKLFKDKLKEKQHSFTYLMLDRILKEVYKISDYKIEFINKKPFLDNRKKYISLSHSDKYIAIGISNTNCGIDIEKIKQRDYKKISARMNFSSANLEDFYKNWTRYEAEFKLSEKPESSESLITENYMITAVSNNADETFDFYFQTSEEIPKLKN